MSFTRKGHHTRAAYSSIGLTITNSKGNLFTLLNDPEDFVGFIDDYVNMIAP